MYSILDFGQDIAKRRGNITYILLFAGIAIGVLLIACANFINLATAGSAHRAKEIGVRKTFGADHGRLTFQFLTESILVSLAALVIALILIELALPSFNTMTERDLRLEYLAHPWILPGFVLFAIFVGLLAGIYPAVSLSSMNPAAGLKGLYRSRESRSALRRVLVVGQYIISIALIIGTAMIYNQVNFMKNKNLGFAKDQLLVVPGFNVWPASTAAAVMSEIAQAPGVIHVSGAWAVPGESIHMMNFLPDGPNAEEILMTQIYADESYQPTLGLELTAGRNFSRQMGSDIADAVLINEAAARKLGWEDAVGKTISRQVSTPEGLVWQPRKVVGVVKDFHYMNLHETIQPLIIICAEPPFRYLSIRLETTDISHTLDMIRDRWNRLSRGYPIDYFFMDQKFAERYKAEERLGKIAVSFSLLAIFVACLGLFGMASHAARQRIKEIGVRKVLGATVRGIAALLATDLVKWVLIANVIAWPIAYYVMNRWLQNFAYRTSLSPGVFFLSGVLAMVVAVGTVAYQAIRAARANPVDSLKYE
ncbi:MAG: FtsX-like permease family protein [Candidatus Zixiibacteriota bacterium]|nr:MAG: FtsX-like permease family protein [candidate division Zixibacteria bacterium]